MGRIGFACQAIAVVFLDLCIAFGCPKLLSRWHLFHPHDRTAIGGFVALGTLILFVMLMEQMKFDKDWAARKAYEQGLRDARRSQDSFTD